MRGQHNVADWTVYVELRGDIERRARPARPRAKPMVDKDFYFWTFLVLPSLQPHLSHTISPHPLLAISPSHTISHTISHTVAHTISPTHAQRRCCDPTANVGGGLAVDPTTPSTPPPRFTRVGHVDTAAAWWCVPQRWLGWSSGRLRAPPAGALQGAVAAVSSVVLRVRQPRHYFWAMSRSFLSHVSPHHARRALRALPKCPCSLDAEWCLQSSVVVSALCVFRCSSWSWFPRQSAGTQTVCSRLGLELNSPVAQGTPACGPAAGITQTSIAIFIAANPPKSKPGALSPMWASPGFIFRSHVLRIRLINARLDPLTAGHQSLDRRPTHMRKSRRKLFPPTFFSG